MSKEYSYDGRCGDLARVFLEDATGDKSEAAVQSLAQTIQDAIEDWINAREPSPGEEKG